MGMTLDLLSAAVGRGPLVLEGAQLARFQELQPIFSAVSRRSAGHPNGPAPETLLQAIAWQESRFSWKPGQSPEPVGVKLRDVAGVGFDGHERALGVMQVWSGHDGKRFGRGWWPESGGSGLVWTVDNWMDPTTNIVAGTEILLDGGLGRKAAWEVLRIYSGARPSNTKAIREYVSGVTSRHLYLEARKLIGNLG